MSPRLCLPAILYFCYACSSPTEELDASKYQEPKISRQKAQIITEIPAEFQFNRTSDVIDSIMFVPLETSSESLIATINDVKCDGDTLFVGDFRKARQILMYDSKGKYLNKIAHLGPGPNEYINLTDFQIDTAANLIYLLDGDLGKILVFDYKGEHRQNITLPFKFANHFILGQDSLIYIEFGFRPNDFMASDPRNVVVYDMCTDKVVQSYFPYDNNTFKLRLKKNTFSAYQDRFYTWETLGNKVYRIGRDSLQTVYEIEGETPTYPFSFYGLTYKDVRKKVRG